jgi:outer membrane murein-binding lipoprotein Lpp
MSTLKNLASIFVKMDDEEADVPETAAPQTASAPAAAPAWVPPPSAAPLLSAGSHDPAQEGKISDKLTQAMAENNLDGIDFFEFRKTLDALVGVIPDEPTRYKAAFGSLVAQGGKPEHITQTAEQYLKVLEVKGEGFAAYLEEQQLERVQAKVDEAEGIKRQIQAKADQIAQLTQEIGKLSEAEIAARSAAALAKGELDAYGKTFQTVKTRFAYEIQAVQAKISHYILNTPKA